MFKKTMTVQLLIGCILIISACKHSYEMPNTWGSYIGSLTVAHGDYIYHADYDHGIYKVNMHTGESQKFLQTEGSARSLNIIKDRLYYTESVGDFVSVYSIGLDGTDLRTECSSSTWYILNMIIHDNVIYFYDFIKTDDQYYQNIYRVNLDGTDKTPLTEAYAHLSICGIYKGRLYYRVKNGGIYETPTSHMQPQLVVDDEIKEAFMVDEKLYFTNAAGRFQCMSLDNNNTIISYDAPSVGYFVADKRFIYYHNPLDEQRVYRMTLDGKQVIKLIDDTDAVGLSIFGDRLFFLTGEAHTRYEKFVMKIDGTERQQLVLD